MNRADNKSVPRLYIYISFTIFSSLPRSSYHPPSTSSSGWKILRRESGERNCHYDALVFSLHPSLLIITRLDARATRLRFNNLLVSLMITSLLICSLTFSEIAHPRRERDASPRPRTVPLLVIRLKKKEKRKKERRQQSIFLIASRSSHRAVSKTLFEGSLIL